jgi:hypothetical protein
VPTTSWCKSRACLRVVAMSAPSLRMSDAVRRDSAAWLGHQQCLRFVKLEMLYAVDRHPVPGPLLFIPLLLAIAPLIAMKLAAVQCLRMRHTPTGLIAASW